MFCVACGAQLPDDAVFCVKCGKRMPGAGIEGMQPVSQDAANVQNVAEEPEGKMSVQKKKLGDGAMDKMRTMLNGGQKIETVRISMEDMLDLLNQHFILPASTEKEYKEIQKAINGGMMGVTHLDSKDGNYYLSVKVAMQLGGKIDPLHPGDSNWITIQDKTTGKLYQYSSFTWGKFKKAVKQEISKAQ